MPAVRTALLRRPPLGFVSSVSSFSLFVPPMVCMHTTVERRACAVRLLCSGSGGARAPASASSLMHFRAYPAK